MRSDSSATELTRIRLDYSNDDQTFVIARIVKIRHKQVRPARLPRLQDHGALPSGRSCRLAVGHTARSAAAWRSGPPADPGALRLAALLTHVGETRSRTATAPRPDRPARQE
jgi:hypothetical protein